MYPYTEMPLVVSRIDERWKWRAFALRLRLVASRSAVEGYYCLQLTGRVANTGFSL